MSDGNIYIKLGDVCHQITDGSHNPPAGVEFSDYPMLSSKNIGFDKLDYCDPRYLTKEQFDAEDRRTHVSVGDVLLTIVGTVGRSCCISEPFQRFTLQRSVAVLKPNTDLIIPRYLMYSLASLAAYFDKEAKGVAQKGIYLKQLAKVPIPIPPLKDQKLIVSELDLLSGILEKQRLQLKELDTLALSVFYDMFGDPVNNDKRWDVTTVGNVCDFVNGFAFKSDRFKKEGLPILRISNIQNDAIVEEDMVFFSPLDYKEDFTKYEVYNGDIVVAMSGATTGKLGVHKGNRTYYLNQRVGKFAIKNRQRLLEPYLFYYLKLMSSQILSDAMGVAQPNISSGQIKGYSIPLPPIILQQSFASQIECIEQQKNHINQSIVETKKLWDYTMEKYFG